MNSPGDPEASDASGDPVLEALWQRALIVWEEDKSHNALLEYALRAHLLPDLARRYRSLVGDIERGPRAQKRLDAIIAAAMQSLLSTKTPRPEKIPLSITLSAFGVCAVLLAWLAWALWGPR